MATIFSSFTYLLPARGLKLYYLRSHGSDLLSFTYLLPARGLKHIKFHRAGAKLMRVFHLPTPRKGIETRQRIKTDEADKLSVQHEQLICFIRYAEGYPVPHLFCIYAIRCRLPTHHLGIETRQRIKTDEADKLSVQHEQLICFIRYAEGYPVPHLLCIYAIRCHLPTHHLGIETRQRIKTDEADKLSVQHEQLICFIRYAEGYPVPHLFCIYAIRCRLPTHHLGIETRHRIKSG